MPQQEIPNKYQETIKHILKVAASKFNDFLNNNI
jgi:hypothetical protein